ncbi:hypothetical protein RB620_01000 [Paenibacillus sp. LHD-117]|uniref:hypothetical protein n=1 Tax=Paenibacillus sp. LHD-117 TaxID=3071412 RepID=UPI0027DFE7C5|nr:hypothetical protein [Paenibacillus sp. LHD-117]MDQ6418002.1 hypothetical protein [Paenibacillus sp. LHD-117]
MANELPDIFKEINKKDNLPSDCFRRNSPHYNLVSYINNIIALYLSDSYEFIPVFIKRADKEITDLTNRIGHHKYFDNCRVLLSQVANQVNNAIDNVIDDILPLLYRGDNDRYSRCPEKFCFHWVEKGTKRLPFQFSNVDEAYKISRKFTPSKTSYCGCAFETCKRLVLDEDNKDWYEPNEPLLEEYKVSAKHFIIDS